jgi:hypothetical protein
MVRAECIWCGDPDGTTKHGLLWIHRTCFEEITDCCQDIKAVVEFAKGERPRILANGDKEGYEALEKYLIEMQAFRQRYDNVAALLKKLSFVDDSSKEVEQK